MLRLRTEDVLWSRVGDEVVVFDRRDDTYLGINQSGAVLWDHLAAGCSPDDLVRALADRFGLSPGVAAQDARAFVEALRRRSLCDSDTVSPE